MQQPSISEKKLVEPLQNLFFFLDSICTEKGSLWATPKIDFFFAEIAKADHQLSESFYFIVFQILFQILIQ